MERIKKISYYGLMTLVAVPPSFGVGNVKQEQKPNVIFIMADDLGWGDVGYHGNTIIKTPHIDHMSREGVRFDRFYSAAPVSSPTRASCLTGRHPYRTGVFSANVGILRQEEITLAEVLKEQGYNTGHFGKWHLGTFSVDSEDGNRGGSPEYVNPPSLHGFDTYFSAESKVPTWDPMKKPKVFTGEDTERYWKCISPESEWEPFGTAYWDKNGKVHENLEGDDSRVIMDRVIPFVHNAIEKKKPFFAVIWFHAPHLPCVAGPDYAAMYKDQNFEMQQYAGCITAMDDQIGRLRKKLAELGVDNNTIITFCSDNGPEGNDNAPGKTGGFKGRKRSINEGGVRVPGIILWPEKITPMFTQVPAVTSDYMPTIMDILGLPLSSFTHPLDGISLWPLLKGEPFERTKPIAFVSNSQIALNGANKKIYRNPASPGVELYDMQSDSLEQHNIAAENDPLTKTMLSEFNLWYESCRNSFEGKDYHGDGFSFLKQRWPENIVDKVSKQKE